MKAQGGMRSFTFSLTSAVHGGGWLTPRPNRFSPRKETRYLLYGRLGRPQSRSGRVRQTSPRPGFDSPTVQPAVPAALSRPTLWSFPPVNRLAPSLCHPHLACRVKFPLAKNWQLTYTIVQEKDRWRCEGSEGRKTGQNRTAATALGFGIYVLSRVVAKARRARGQ